MNTPLADPRVVVFAGPNGAGKSTHADAILAELHIPTFINADYIARGLAGQHTQTVALAAGRLPRAGKPERSATRWFDVTDQSATGCTFVSTQSIKRGEQVGVRQGWVL